MDVLGAALMFNNLTHDVKLLCAREEVSSSWEREHTEIKGDRSATPEVKDMVFLLETPTALCPGLCYRAPCGLPCVVLQLPGCRMTLHHAVCPWSPGKASLFGVCHLVGALRVA